MNLDAALTTEDPTIGRWGGMRATRRNAPNFWEPYSWAVRVIVDRGYGVTEACRRVLERGQIEATKENIACLRVRYYNVKKKPWPKSLQSLRANKGEAVVGKTGQQIAEELAGEKPESMEAEWGEGDIESDPLDDFEV
jgi:hypothetical protein